VTFRNVKVGPRVDGLWVIEDGLKGGEKVVVEGLQRVREGSVVSPKPAAAPAAGKVASGPSAEAK
jgi:membrane fusion protein (multidrug efflux system)